MSLRIVVLTVMCFSLLGCDGPDQPTAVQPSISRAQRVASAAAGDFDVLRAAREARNTDAFFARIHKAVPGFAGMTFEDGIPTIYMASEGSSDFVKEVLAPSS